MTLGELIEALKNYPATRAVAYGFGAGMSYRGRYEEIAFEPLTNTTAGEMLINAQNCVGSTFEGYKGGDYKMGLDTIVNIADYGECGDDDEINIGKIINMLGYPILEDAITSQEKPIVTFIDPAARRELAGVAMAAIIEGSAHTRINDANQRVIDFMHMEDVAKSAVRFADALLKELAK